jgi:hypothetical protein
MHVSVLHSADFICYKHACDILVLKMILYVSLFVFSEFSCTSLLYVRIAFGHPCTCLESLNSLVCIFAQHVCLMVRISFGLNPTCFTGLILLLLEDKQGLSMGELINLIYIGFYTRAHALSHVCTYIYIRFISLVRLTTPVLCPIQVQCPSWTLS